MAQNNLNLVQSDLIRQLSRETLDYLTSDSVPLSPVTKEIFGRDKHRGSFIRVANVILVASGIDFGAPNVSTRTQRRIDHRDLKTEFTKRYQQLFDTARVRATTEPLIDMNAPANEAPFLHDAGYWRLLPPPVLDAPREFVIQSNSLIYAHASNAARLRTTEVAQILVGNSINVSAI